MLMPFWFSYRQPLERGRVQGTGGPSGKLWKQKRKGGLQRNKQLYISDQDLRRRNEGWDWEESQQKK